MEDFPSAAKAEESLATATRQLDRLVRPERSKAIKTKTKVRIGKPYQQIVQLAEEIQADLVVMGVRGRGALDVAVFGSTTYRVLQLGPCPVMAVHI